MWAQSKLGARLASTTRTTTGIFGKLGGEMLDIAMEKPKG
jgi:hypothetical protein